jgi:hypothetical protein
MGRYRAKSPLLTITDSFRVAVNFGVVRRRTLSLALLLLHTAMVVVAAPLFPPEPGFVQQENSDFREEAARSLGIEENELRVTWLEENNNARYDSLEYTLMAWGEPSYPPYSLRPTIPFLVGQTTKILVQPATAAEFVNSLYIATMGWNLVFILATGGIVFLTARKLSRDSVLSVTLALGAIVNVGTIQTGSFLMVDPASYFIGALTVYLIASRQPILAGIGLGIGITIKEVVIIYAALMLIPLFSGLRAQAIIGGLIPIGAFMTLRAYLSEDVLSVNYGWNLSQGDFRLEYFFLHTGEPMRFAMQLAIAIGIPVLVGLMYSVRSKKAIAGPVWLVVVLLLSANIFLASGVTRVMQLALPAIILLIASSAGASPRPSRVSPK